MIVHLDAQRLGEINDRLGQRVGASWGLLDFVVVSRAVRTPIPEDIAADVMFRHDRTCCVCNRPGRPVQIHHIDEDPSNHNPQNLAVLCLEDHELTQVKGGFGRKLRGPEVTKNRDDWVRRVRERREAADKIIVERMTAKAILDAASRQEVEWSPPPEAILVAFVNALPDTLRYIYKEASPLWSSIARPDMLHGTQIVLDVLEQAWLRLSTWFPPNHFDDMPADKYFSNYIANRYAWNQALGEPGGLGNGGREAGIIAAGATLRDVEQAIVDTVQNLGAFMLNDFDFDIWHARWKAAQEE